MIIKKNDMKTKIADYAVVDRLTDDQLRKEYGRLKKEVLVEMIINQERIISVLMEPAMKKYEMGLTKNSSCTHGSTT